MMGVIINSKVFTLLDLGPNNKNEYVCVFDSVSIIKVTKFSFFDFKSYNITNQTTIENIDRNRIVSSFIMDSYIVIFYLNNNYMYSFNINDFNLNLLSSDIFMNFQPNEDYNEYDYYNCPYSYAIGRFFKSILLQSNYVAFVHYVNNSYIIQIRNLSMSMLIII